MYHIHKMILSLISAKLCRLKPAFLARRWTISVDPVMEHPVLRSFRRPSRLGVTLVEVLVVVGVVGVLAGMLLPVLQSGRVQLHETMCTHNLKQIALATTMYRQRWNGAFPSNESLGNHAYRMAPGSITIGDRNALPEKYGLQAKFVQGGFLDDTPATWICPLHSAEMKLNRNTYTWSVAAALQKPSTVKNMSSTLWVWDNFSLYPGLSGFNGPFRSYTIPTKYRFYPHARQGENKDGLSSVNVLFADGHVEVREF